MNKKPKSVRILLTAIVIAVLAITAFNMFLESISRNFSPAGNIFYAEQMTTDDNGYEQKTFVFLEFTNDGILNMILTDEYYTSITKTVFDYTYHTWDNIGNIYFKTDSILSFTTFEEDAIPITMRMNCIQSRGFYCPLSDDETSIITYEETENVGYTFDAEAFFYEDSVLFDGIVFDKIDALDPVCAELIRLFIDTDDIFYQHNNIS